ncbi:hypothetical protein Efla_001342 [Eimeria flavescens]
MDSEVLTRLCCSLQYVLSQRYIVAALEACCRGEFYEGGDYFALWRVVAIAADFKTSAAIKLLECVERGARTRDHYGFPLQQIRRVLLARERTEKDFMWIENDEMHRAVARPTSSSADSAEDTASNMLAASALLQLRDFRGGAALLQASTFPACDVQKETEGRCCLEGWLRLALHESHDQHQRKEQELAEAESWFLKAQEHGRHSRKGIASPTTFFGVAEVYRRRNQWLSEQALRVLSELEGREPWQAAAPLQRALLLISTSKWREAAAAASIAAAVATPVAGSELQEPALLLLALLRLCSESGFEGGASAVATIKKIKKSIMSSEPAGFEFVLDVSRAFCSWTSWCCDNHTRGEAAARGADTLKATLSLACAVLVALRRGVDSEASQNYDAAAMVSQFRCEVAWQTFLTGYPDEATGKFVAAAATAGTPEQKHEALDWQVVSLLLQPKYAEAARHLTSADELEGAVICHSALRFLLRWELDGRPGGSSCTTPEFLSTIHDASAEWRKRMQETCGFKLYASLRTPHWLFVVSRILLKVTALTLPSDLNGTTSQPIAASTLEEQFKLMKLLQLAAGIVQTVLKHAPAHRDARVLLALTLLLRGDLHSSNKVLEESEGDGASRTPEPLLLLLQARCCSLLGKTTAASRKIDLALKLAPGLRSIPACALLQASIRAQAGSHRKALCLVDVALACCCLSRPTKPIPMQNHSFNASCSTARSECYCNQVAARTKVVGRNLRGMSPIPLHCTAYERLIAQLLRVELLAHIEGGIRGQRAIDLVAREMACETCFAWGGTEMAVMLKTPQGALALLARVSDGCETSCEAHLARAEVHMNPLENGKAADWGAATATALA